MLWGMKVADDDSSEFTVYGNERMIAGPFSFINRVILKRFTHETVGIFGYQKARNQDLSQTEKYYRKRFFRHLLN